MLGCTDHDSDDAPAGVTVTVGCCVAIVPPTFADTTWLPADVLLNVNAAIPLASVRAKEGVMLTLPVALTVTLTP